MATVITELANFSTTAFFDNRTWLNQENWQAYFGGSIPSGVLVEGKLGASGQLYTDALTMRKVNSSYMAFNAGTIMADGIFAEYSASTQFAVLTSADLDRLIVARVYLQAGTVKLVGKTKIAQDTGYTTSVYATMLLQDESLGCIRNDTYYEIPLVYEVYGGGTYDLRRLYYLPSKASPFLTINFNGQTATNLTPDMNVLYGKTFVQVHGGMAYDIEIDAADTSTALFIYPIPTTSEKPTIVYIKNNSATAKQICLPLQYRSLTYSYEWIDNWTVEDVDNAYKYKSLVAEDKMMLILTPYTATNTFGYAVSSKSVSEGSLDPDDYFTKQEVADLLATKVSQTYVDTELALKADSADLGDLAYQDTANYQTQLTNKPTLGALAAKNKVTLTTDVTGVLPIANGGTGGASIADIIANIFGDKTYYVNSSTGDDTTGTGTSANPFKTIQKAIDTVGYASHGTIRIKNGAYNENITVPFSKSITLTYFNSPSQGFISLAGNINVSGGKIAISTPMTITSSLYNCVYVDNGGTINTTAEITLNNTSTATTSYNQCCINISNGSTAAFKSDITLTSNRYGVRTSGASTVYIDGGTMTVGSYAIYCDGSTVFHGNITGTWNTFTQLYRGGLVRPTTASS